MTSTLPLVAAEVIQCRRPDVDPNDWFAGRESPRTVRAKRLCLDCPLFWACQEYALREGVPNGVWGGVDEWTREALWKRHGGKPTNFLDDIARAAGLRVMVRDDGESTPQEAARPDAQLGPLLQSRRDYEKDNNSTHNTTTRGQVAS